MSRLSFGWSSTTLAECADWYSGGTPDTSVPAFWNGDIPWITSSSLHNFYLTHSERQLTKLGLENGSRLMPENTIIFVVRGMSLKTEFRLGITRKPVAFGQDCKALIAKSGIDPWYLAYAIKSKSNDILGMVDEAGHETGRLQTEVLKQIEISVQPLPKGLGVPPEVFLGVLGVTGLTAYFGLLEVGRPKRGETVVVSGAAGATGSVVGQIARIKGCRAVGIAGGADKCRFVTEELGFDACIDYKSGPVRDGLKQHCPNGVDVYFDNVGGEILDTVLTRINRKARIVICGAISQYNNLGAVQGPKNYLSLLVNRARMEGMVVFDYASR